MKFKKLSEAEFDVLNVLWSFERPARPIEIVPEINKIHAWSISTVNTLLDRLTNKGVVKLEYIGRYRYYEPLMTQNEYFRRNMDTLAGRLKDISPVGQIASFIDSADVTEDDLNEIERLLQEARARLNNKQ
ncbi:MAG: BlaI/MecI/CopY family transcriptional regulator [Clostridia bacterium]|nr:BlaI/MecI/CopY family transcriptional regulator [Clostridia bacterium]